jgi:hypothetical protein
MTMAAARNPLPNPKTARELLDLYFLDLRCHLLEAAAAFDRIERSPGAADALQDPRLQKLRAGLDILKSGGTDRAERFLSLFSA